MINKLLKYRCFRFFLENTKAGPLAGKCILLLLIPYAYLFLCGFVFDMLLRWYFMTTYIFISLIVLYIIAIALVVMAVKHYREYKREKNPKAGTQGGE